MTSKLNCIITDNLYLKCDAYSLFPGNNFIYMYKGSAIVGFMIVSRRSGVVLIMKSHNKVFDKNLTSGQP